MEKFETAVYNFIEQMAYLENRHVLGIVLYGSYVTGYNHEKSDIDLHIIMDNSCKKIYRGVKIVNGFQIEYFEKPISDLYSSANHEFKTYGNALLPIIGEGRILFARNGRINRLRKYINKKYQVPLPPLAGDDAKEMAVIIYNRISKLETMFENNLPEFNFNYYLIVEKIRKFYSRMCGCADIPVDKAFKVYTDAAYRASFCKSKIPDLEFITLFFQTATNNGSPEEKMALIRSLYEYVTRNLDINPYNYRISIKSRNNPFNRNHE